MPGCPGSCDEGCVIWEAQPPHPLHLASPQEEQLLSWARNVSASKAQQCLESETERVGRELSLPRRCCWSWMGAAGREGKEKLLPVLGTRARRERATRESSAFPGHSFYPASPRQSKHCTAECWECPSAASPTPKHCRAGQIVRKEPKTSMKERGKQRVAREGIGAVAFARFGALCPA